LDINLNIAFNKKSALSLYYDAGWLPERIRDSEVDIPSVLSISRLSETKQVTDRLTGKKRLTETELVKRNKAKGKTDEYLLEAADNFSALLEDTERLKGHKDYSEPDPYDLKERKSTRRSRGWQLLDLLRIDIFTDVCGVMPLSDVNYLRVTVYMMSLFSHIEDRLRKARHPLYVHAYEDPVPSMRQQKRLALVMEVMGSEDDGALKLFAQEFERLRASVLDCIYWDLRTGKSDDESTTGYWSALYASSLVYSK
jgi:hypothetical protein